MIDRVMLAARVLRPYYGRAIAALRPIAVDMPDDSPGMSIDASWRLYCSARHMADWTDMESAALVGHMVEHLLHRHPGRRGLRLPSPWARACDCALADDDDQIPSWVLQPGDYDLDDGRIEEEYYPAIADMEELPEGWTCGSGAGGPSYQWELASSPDDMTQEAIDSIIVMTAKDTVDRQRRRGDVPAGVMVWADEEAAETPPVDWRRLLSAAVGATAGDGNKAVDRSRLHRRYRHGWPIAPGSRSQSPRVCIVADTSGSMAMDGDTVLGVVADLMRRYECDIYACDVDPVKVRHGRYIGGGGTDMRAGIAAAEKTSPSAIIVITDGVTPWPDAAPSAPTIAVMVGESAPPAPEWATVIEIGDNDDA